MSMFHVNTLNQFEVSCERCNYNIVFFISSTLSTLYTHSQKSRQASSVYMKENSTIFRRKASQHTTEMIHMAVARRR